MTWPSTGLVRACRALWRPPTFLPLASLTLAIGLAAFASGLGMVESLLSAPPFPHHADTVIYGEKDRDPQSLAASPRAYDAIGMPPGVLSHGAAHVSESVNVRLDDREALARGQRVDAGFLPTLGVRSVLPEDSSVRFENGVMLSHAFWLEWLGGDPRAVGRHMTVNGATMIVRGVLPPDYRLFTDIDLLLPLASTGGSRDTAANLTALAYLAPGVSADSVSRWLRARSAASGMAEYGRLPLDGVLTSKARPIVLLCFVCSLLVLAIAGVNLSNLMLTRALRRTHEACLMAAFGGFGWRSRLPAIVDVVAISIVAVVVGLFLADAMVTVIRPFVPRTWLISARPIELSWRVCAAAGVVGLAMTSAAATLGAAHANTDRLLRTQFASGGTLPLGTARRARRLMVGVQMALATMLLVLGVATTSRLWRVMQIPLGFDPADTGFVEINPDAQQFPTGEDVSSMVDAVRLAATQRPGVEVAGVTTLLPVGPGFFLPFQSPHGGKVSLQYAMVSPGATEAMGLTLTAGRGIGADDRATSPAVAVVNQAYLDHVDSRGIGAPVTPAFRLLPNRSMRIVGIVANTRSSGAEQAAVPTVFLPYAQADSHAYAFIRRFIATYIVIRGPGEPMMAARDWRAMVHQVAPGLAVGQPKTFQNLSRRASDEARRNAILAAIFATMAVSLACIGLYAVQSLEVTSRSRDIALRDALGATPLDHVGHALSRGMGMATPGISLGLIAAIALERAIEPLALETGPIDAGVATMAALSMIIATLAAVAVPAVRAAGITPVHVLRGEMAMSSRRRHSEAIRP